MFGSEEGTLLFTISKAPSHQTRQTRQTKKPSDPPTLRLNDSMTLRPKRLLDPNKPKEPNQPNQPNEPNKPNKPNKPNQPNQPKKRLISRPDPQNLLLVKKCIV